MLTLLRPHQLPYISSSPRVSQTFSQIPIFVYVPDSLKQFSFLNQGQLGYVCVATLKSGRSRRFDLQHLFFGLI